MKRVLITGGAGYIGSHVLEKLSNNKDIEVIVVDNLSNGNIKNIIAGEFIQGDFGDEKILDQIFSKKIHTVIHLAASTVVPESMENPLKYYENNTLKTFKLLKYASKSGTDSFIFSSTAAVYGDSSGKTIVDESSELNPKSPYAHSKLMSEQMIQDISATTNMKYCILRYFNVAGVSSSGAVGPYAEGATHLIKVCAEAASGKRDSITIFGTDYETKDGSGVRDYIHVEDLARLHIMAMESLESGAVSQTYNCGYSDGYSVKEVISAMKEVSGSNFEVKEAPRRDGDISALMANSDKIKKDLSWTPEFNSLKQIVESAYNWELKIK